MVANVGKEIGLKMKAHSKNVIDLISAREMGIYSLENLFLRTGNYDFIICFIPKIACTYIKHNILNSLYGDITKISPKYFMDNWTIFDIIHAMSHECLRVDGREALRRQATLITFCRNPYHRIISAYKNKIIKPHSSEQDHYKWIRREIFFNTCRTNPGQHIADEMSKGIHFNRFIEFIGNTPSNNRDIHWAEQYLLNSADLIGYDHIVKFENFQNEFEELWKEHTGIKDMVEKAEKNKSPNKILEIDQNIADMIYEIYKRDFEIFGYDKDSWKSFAP